MHEPAARYPAMRAGTIAVLWLLCVPAYAGEAETWLMRMSNSARDLNYEGTFIYRHDRRVESMRILHQSANGHVRERLTSLNGAAREIIRDNREVRCYLPDQQVVVVEQMQTEGRSFPALVPESLRGLNEYYRLSVGQDARVADRGAREIIVEPRDAYRYGYRFWADDKTGLLLKANLVDVKNVLIEEFMFTDVVIGRPIPDARFNPGTIGKGFVWHRPSTGAAALDQSRKWQAVKVPPGFILSRHQARLMPSRPGPVEHLVYTDGLAVVSVFVELAGAAGTAVPERHIGAVNTVNRMLDGHSVTAVGEVPMATIEMIAASVTATR